jgi:hypothetical protein
MSHPMSGPTTSAKSYDIAKLAKLFSSSVGISSRPSVSSLSQPSLQTLRVVCVARLARPGGAARRPRPADAATLAVHGGAAAAAVARCGAAVVARRSAAVVARVAACVAARCRGAAAAGAELGLDEGDGLRAVLVPVVLVGGGVVAVAAVRVRRVAVRLDLAGLRAREAGRAGVELGTALAFQCYVGPKTRGEKKVRRR